MGDLNLFHISLPCLDIKKTKAYYQDVLNADIGRSASNWLDVNLYDHQITFCQTGDFVFDYAPYKFEKTILPSFHFGVILGTKDWHELYERVSKDYNLDLDKTLFLGGKPGEHVSFFLKDPNGYHLEFKCFSESDNVFKR